MELLKIFAEAIAGHMPNIIVRWAYPEKKIVKRVRISQSGVLSATVSIAPNKPTVRMSLQIRNSLPVSIELSSIYGEIVADEYNLINNFTKLLHEKVMENDEKDFTITDDLPLPAAAIVGNHRAENFNFSLRGKLVFKAFGKEVVMPVDVPVNATINGSHGNQEK